MLWCVVLGGPGLCYDREMEQQYTEWMRECLRLAQQAELDGDVPIGAIVVYKNKVIGTGKNNREAQQSVLGHAELQALQQASGHLQSWRLSECTLISTLEPCVMCSGAIVQSRIQTLVYGATDPKGGGQTLFALLNSEKLNHRVNLVSGVLQEECSQLLVSFFKKRRSK